jgi:hypothetical protein
MTNTDQGEAPAGTTSGATGISDSPARGTPWYLHPAVISALVVAAATVLAAIVSLITNWITLSYDTTFEQDKNKTTVLLGILQDYNPNMVPPRNEQMMKDRITIAIQSGLISDEDGSICLAFLKQGCPVKVLRVK